MTAPSRVMFLFSCCILQLFPFLRFACADEVEDMLAVVAMLTTAPYFLFFCRGFKTVGPFVVMIYRMIMGDLLRFVSIYLVFVMGFSQGKRVAFRQEDTSRSFLSISRDSCSIYLYERGLVPINGQPCRRLSQLIIEAEDIMGETSSISAGDTPTGRCLILLARNNC